MDIEFFIAYSLFLFPASLVVAVVVWILCSKIKSVLIRRTVRILDVILIIPIGGMNHPPAIFQIWMFLIVDM